MPSRRIEPIPCLALLALPLVSGWSAPASAETFVVTQVANPAVVDVVGADCDTEGANDTIDVGALCGGTSAPCDGPGISLAEAICAANVTPGPDTIELAPGATYEVPCTHNSWYGRNALPIITSEIVIEGNGARIERVSAGYCRFFFVAGACAESQAPTVGQLAPRGHLTLRHLTLANGWVRGGEGRDGGGGGAGLGGAIFNEGTLDVEGVLFLSNHAEGGHAVYSESHGAGGGLSGRGGNFRVGPLGLSVGFGGGFGGVNFGDGDFRIGGGFGGCRTSRPSPGFGGGSCTVAPFTHTGETGGFGGGGAAFRGGGFGGGAGYNGDGGFGGGAGGRPTTGEPVRSGGFAGGANDDVLGAGGGGLGGAVFNLRGTMRALNCTFAGNEARGGGQPVCRQPAGQHHGWRARRCHLQPERAPGAAEHVVRDEHAERSHDDVVRSAFGIGRLLEGRARRGAQRAA